MTTFRQVKRVLAPLVERHEDLVVMGRWLMLKPVRHIARGILIERMGSANWFRPWWAVTNLCEPQDSFPLNWATMIHREGHRLWEWSDPSLQADLFEAIETQALPTLRAINTLDDFVTFASSKEQFSLTAFNSYLLRRVGVDIARGDLAAARATCAELATGRTKWSNPFMREEFTRVTESLCPLLHSDDRAGIARVLHEWEAHTARNLKIEAIWEPTPFPLELQMGGNPAR